MDTRYLSCADTAKLVRKAVKESFPATKFSVTSKTYSGGASIDVRWTDGPTTKQVDKIVKRFEGAYFDGMIDYKGAVYAQLNGENVRFGANFVFATRDNSDAEVAKAIAAVLNKFSPLPEACNQNPTVDQWRNGLLYNQIAVTNARETDRYWSLQDLVWRQLAEQTDVVAAPSPTADSAKIVGDDGYGCGPVSTSMNGYPRVNGVAI